MATTRENLMKMARQAKKLGLPVTVVTKKLRPEFQHLVPELEAEHERFEPRRK